jgi:multidrug efflux pump subunit AcrA (membrane-fusion protein)
LNRVTKNKLIVSAIALVILLTVAFYSYERWNASRDTETTFETTTISTGNIILSATGLGALVPSEEVSFGFKSSGQVSEALVSLGEQVEAGQVLARLENKTLQLQYKQAKGNLAALGSPAEISAAEQSLQDAKASLETAKDDLQFMVGPEMFVAEEGVAAAQAELEAAKAAAEQDPSDAWANRFEAESLAKAQETLTMHITIFQQLHVNLHVSIRNQGAQRYES